MIIVNVSIRFILEKFNVVGIFFVILVEVLVLSIVFVLFLNNLSVWMKIVVNVEWVIDNSFFVLGEVIIIFDISVVI